MIRVSDDQRVWFTRQVTNDVLAEFEAYRNVLRRLASDASGESDRPARLALITAIERFGDLEDTVRERLRQPSRLDTHHAGRAGGQCSQCPLRSQRVDAVSRWQS